MGCIAKNRYSYLYETEWIREASTWRPPDTITLRDDTGAPIPSSSMTDMLLTVYDLMDPEKPVLAGVNQVNVKNLRGCTINTSGVFVLSLLPTDTRILDYTRDYELRRALIQYTYASGAKSDALEITFAIRNLFHRNEVTGDAAVIGESVQIVLV